MNPNAFKQAWLDEEREAHMHGWDFSHIKGRYTEEDRLPWDYAVLVREHLHGNDRLLDIDTGGGEFLLSLGHPYAQTAATEAWPPNVRVCRETLQALGVDFRDCAGNQPMPFDDASFDLIINRHGSFCPVELFRILKPGGLFITQQVGEENDRELVELLLPGTPKPFPGMNLSEQRRRFERAGFTILRDGEARCPIRFYDVGALVWFARVIEWEFPGFTVSGCLPRLALAQRLVESQGYVEGSIHRYLIVAKKAESNHEGGHFVGLCNDSNGG